MKKIIVIALLMLAASKSLVFAQSCSGSPMFTQGKQFVYLMERPDGRGGPNATPKQIKATYQVQNVSNSGGITTASYSIIKWEDASDPNAKAPAAGIYTGGICSGYSVSYLAHANIGMTTLDDTTELPINMKVGDKLKDKTFSFSAPGKDPVTINVLRHINVVAQEQVTTPAGTWNCFKIAVASTTTMPAVGRFPGGTQTATEYLWFTPEVGLIKSQVSARV